MLLGFFTLFLSSPPCYLKNGMIEEKKVGIHVSVLEPCEFEYIWIIQIEVFYFYSLIFLCVFF